MATSATRLLPATPPWLAATDATHTTAAPAAAAVPKPAHPTPGAPYLAQMNLVRANRELTTETTPRFVALLAPLNALAARSNGYVWQLPVTDGIAAGARIADDPQLIMNLSVWQTPDDLQNFVQSSRQQEATLGQEWIVRIPEPAAVLWWSPPEHRPGPDEAYHRLTLLRRIGVGPEAFTVRQMFPPPAATQPGVQLGVAA